jgi:hypothetical protein
MDDSDPHIHVDKSAVQADAAARNLVASTFGLVAKLPNVVTTGCGVRVPRARTSKDPGQVTCLPCREHARDQHLSYAAQIERLAGMPGMNITEEQARQAAAKLRDLAERFANP